MKIAIEPRPRETISNSDAMMMLLKEVDSPSLGVLVDTGHLFAVKEILPVSIWKLRRSIFAVHLTDNDGLIEHQWAPGEGKIDWVSVLQAFKRANYDGYFTIETSGAGVQAADFVKAKEMIENLVAETYLEVPSYSQTRMIG